MFMLLRITQESFDHQSSGQTVEVSSKHKAKIKQFKYYERKLKMQENLAQCSPEQKGIRDTKLKDKSRKLRQALVNKSQKIKPQKFILSSNNSTEMQKMTQVHLKELIQGQNHIRKCSQCLMQRDINNMVFQQQGDSIQVLPNIWKNNKGDKSNAIELVCKCLNKKEESLIVVGKKENDIIKLDSLHITSKDEVAIRNKFRQISSDIKVRFVPIYRRQGKRKIFLKDICAVMICCHPSIYRQSGYCIMKQENKIIGVDYLMYSPQKIKEGFKIPGYQNEYFLYEFMQKKMMDNIKKKNKESSITHQKENQLFQFGDNNYSYRNKVVIIIQKSPDMSAEQIKKKFSLRDRVKCQIYQDNSLINKEIIYLSCGDIQSIEEELRSLRIDKNIVKSKKGVVSTKIIVQDSIELKFQQTRSSMLKSIQVEGQKIQIQSQVFINQRSLIETIVTFRDINSCLDGLLYLKKKGFEVDFV